ncbi:MAG: hypothetical protein K0R00_15 [Herbinix sp.]|nr:hypothetical protein [Herbinix sp.]
MPSFDELGRPGKCDVCSKEANVVVLSSSMGPISWAYCENCATKRLEPYGGMIAYISSLNYPDDVNPDYVKEIRRILKELGKTEEEFIADCKKSNEEYTEYLKNQSEELCEESEEE